MTRATYLLGGPGVGKSTLMAELMSDWTVGEYIRLTEREFFGHELEHDIFGDGMYLGKLREEYPGTDALSMSVSPHAVFWAEELIPPSMVHIFGEGRRLGNMSFLTALHENTDLTIYNLVLDQDSAVIRLDLREFGEKGLNPKGYSSRKGTKMNMTHIVSSFTVANNTAAACRIAGFNIIDLDANLTTAQMMELI